MGFRGIVKFAGARAFEGLIAVLLITFMPNLPPDAKYSLNYDLTPVMPFEGPLTLNQKLQGAEVWHKGDFHGAEAFAVYNGELYTSIHGGNVVKLIGEEIAPVVKFGKTCKGFYQEHICGRPLGMQFDNNGWLYVADAYYGIFKVDVKTGKQVQLVSMDEEINGKKPKLPNSVAVASNGDVYWTDSSTEFFLYDGVLDMLADGSGRLIHYDASNKQNTVLIDKVHFSNGVKLAKDESFVIVTETARCRVQRYHLKGPKKGTHDIFLDGLPGLPDNIQTDGKDGFIIPLVVGRDEDHPPPLNILGPFPLIRKFASRVIGLTELGFKIIDQIYPCEFAERAMHYIGHFQSIPHSFSSPRQTILHVSKEGEILDSIHSLDASIVGMSEAFIFKDMLYMGSPFNDYIGRIPLSKVGWEHLALKESDYPSSQSAESIKTSTKESKSASITDAPKLAVPQPTQAPRVVTQPSAQKEDVHVHKREAPPEPTPTPTPKPTTTTPPPPKPAVQAPAPKPTTPAPKPAEPAPAPTQKPTTASPPAPKPATAVPPAPKPSTTAPPAPKPAAPASAPTQKPATAAPPAPKPATAASPASKPAVSAPAPTQKPATAASPKPATAAPPAPKPATPAPAPTQKPAAPAPPAPKPATAAPPAPKPATAAPPAPKPATPDPAPTQKPATPAPKPATAAPPAPKPATPGPAPTQKPATPAPKPATAAPKPATAAPPPPKPATPGPAPTQKPATPAPPAPKPATAAPPAPKPVTPAPQTPKPATAAPKPATAAPKPATAAPPALKPSAPAPPPTATPSPSAKPSAPATNPTPKSSPPAPASGEPAPTPSASPSQPSSKEAPLKNPEL